MWCITALVAPGVFVAEFDRVTESLTLEAAHGIWNVNVHVVANVTGEQGGRQSGRLKGEAEEAGIASFSVLERGQTAHVRHTFWAESVEDFVLRHVPHLWSEYSTLSCVSGSVQGDSDLFLTEFGALQELFGLGSVFRFHDQGSVRGRFDLQESCAADGFELFGGPKDVDFPERNVFIVGFNVQE